MCIRNTLSPTAQSGEQQTETKWAQITDLDLSEVGALNLGDDGFSSFTALERLNLTNAQLDGLKPQYFPIASKLECIDASCNDLQSLRAVNFQRLTQLKVANFSQNNIKFVAADAFLGLVHLEQLDLENNALTNASIGVCNNLRELKLGNNDIKKVF